MKHKITKLLTMVAVLFGTATAFTGCFPESDIPVFKTGDVIFECKITDYYKKPITHIPEGYYPDSLHVAPTDSVMIILYRATENSQTLATTSAELICDTVYANSFGEYQIKDTNLTEVSSVYGLYIQDIKNVYRIDERHFRTQEATTYERNGRYEFVTYYPVLPSLL